MSIIISRARLELYWLSIAVQLVDPYIAPVDTDRDWKSRSHSLRDRSLLILS